MLEPNNFTKREWIHLLITLSIIQAFIWWVAFQFAGNSSALGYVSFAGTLISIILAVLAIGYTYGESHQQKNSSSTLANQIESLVSIKDKLEIQAEALNNINILKQSLDDFSEKVYGHFENNQKGFDDLKKSKGFGDSREDDKKTQSNESYDSIIPIIFKRSTPFNKACLILLILFIENNKVDSNPNNHKLTDLYKYIKNLNINGFNSSTEHRIFGGIITWFQVLNRIDQLSIERSYVSEPLINIFNEFVNDSSSDFEKVFDGAGGLLIKLSKESKFFLNDCEK